MSRRRIYVAAVPRVLIVAAALLSCAGYAAAQTSSSGLKLTGAINFGVNAAGGTQSRTDVSGSFDLALDGGTTGTSIRRQLRFRAEGLYATSQSPGKPKTIGAEMYYLEMRGAGDLGEMLGSTKRPDEDSGFWIYGIASQLHTIAFDLDAERAAGAGLSYDVAAIGLSVSADLRHIQEEFNTQSEFSSWAIGLHQSYSRSWIVGTAPNTRIFIVSEAIDVIPAFESRDALQARAVISLAIPIVKNWTMPITYGSDYMRNVPPTFKQHFWKTTFSLNYTFGN